MAQEFERLKLSNRENEILDFAIEGLTDQQIAIRLEISTSTVNSYWVRIRGKLGHRSRTELVAAALKEHSQGQISGLESRIRDFEAQKTHHDQAAQDYRFAECYRAALDAMPEPVVVFDETRSIVYANSRFEVAMNLDSPKILGKVIEFIAPYDGKDRLRDMIMNYMENPSPCRLGIDSVLYAQRGDGRIFRIIMLLDSRPTSTGLITTAIVRAFLAEVDDMRQFVQTASRFY